MSSNYGDNFQTARIEMPDLPVRFSETAHFFLQGKANE
jgi:hypothetical protein